MPDLRLLRSDVAAFAEVVGLPLTDWQARTFELSARVSVVVAPRQAGKSRSLSVLALWRAFREPHHRVLIVSAGEEASRRLLAEVRRVAVGSPLLSSSVVDESAALLTLANGSEVRSVPASERQVRGWSVDTLLVDEAAMVADDLLLGAALPTTAARPDARVVLASSPLTASGAFYDHAVRGEAGSAHVRTFRWALTDAEWIAPSVVEAARESMSEARFAAEYLGQFASGADAVFTRQALDRVTADYLPDELASMLGPARVLAATDWGATTDRSALVAIGRLPRAERRFAVRCAQRWPAGYPLPGVIGEVIGSPAHFDTVVAETNGLGWPLAQELVARLRRREAMAGGARAIGDRPLLIDEEDLEAWFERQRRRRPVRLPGSPAPFTSRALGAHSTAAMKAAGYSALRMLVEREQLLLPASAMELIRELLLLRVDLTPSGGERIEASTGHDDLADALMLATVPPGCRSFDTRQPTSRSYLADLADERRRLPEPDLDRIELDRLAVVRSGGGVDVPRTPVWVSVRGVEVTVPPGGGRDDPIEAYWRRRREAITRVQVAQQA